MKYSVAFDLASVYCQHEVMEQRFGDEENKMMALVKFQGPVVSNANSLILYFSSSSFFPSVRIKGALEIM